MSAFFVTKEDIDLIVSGLREFRVHIPTPDGASYGEAHTLDPDQIGRLLWQENIASLTYRYDLDGDDADRNNERNEYISEVNGYKFKPYNCLKPGPLVKIVHCYEYQCCEHPAWESSKAKDICERLCREILHKMAGYEKDICERLCREILHKMAGYESGPWGISTQDDLDKVCNRGAVSLLDMMQGRK